MHYIFDYGYRLWSWLLANSASRATAILVFITGWYAILTWRMAKAITRQTRAMIQPVALLKFLWKEGQYYPVGYFEIKNLGTQPLLLLDVKLSCHMHEGRNFVEHYTLWDEHIVLPGEALYPQFDFKSQFEKEKLPWSSTWLSYSLQVVASDLSKQVVLTYRNIPVLGIVNVHKRTPLSVRWRYFLKPVGWRYRRLLYRFKRPKLGE
jgi:hypothetical protein